MIYEANFSNLYQIIGVVHSPRNSCRSVVDKILQVVVLSRLFVDESSAVCAATGIKLLVDCLTKTTSDATLVFVADCIARLGHIGAGQSNAKPSVLFKAARQSGAVIVLVVGSGGRADGYIY